MEKCAVSLQLYGLLFCRYLCTAFEPKHNATIPLNRSGIEQSNPEPLVPLCHDQRLLFQHRNKGYQFLTLAYPFISLRFQGGVLLKCGIVAFLNTPGFQRVGILRLGNRGVLFYMCFHKFRCYRHFVVLPLHFGIKLCGVTERPTNKLTVGKHHGSVAHQLVVGNKKPPLDFFLGQLWSPASVLVLEFPVALEYHALILIRGVPDLSAVKPAAISADDFTVESLIAVSPAEFFSPCHFFLHRLKFLRGDNSFMRTFHIILRHLTVIDAKFFCQKIRCKPFLPKYRKADTITRKVNTPPVGYILLATVTLSRSNLLFLLTSQVMSFLTSVFYTSINIFLNTN